MMRYLIKENSSWKDKRKQIKIKKKYSSY